MLLVFSYILVPNIIIISALIFAKNINGSDHYFHIKLVDSIKNNGHKFVKARTYIKFSEENFSYPQLFHWILSFLPEKIYKKKFKYITITVKVIEIISFNLFLLFLHQKLQFNEIVFLDSNIVVNLFPFSYSLWNAKNTGLSARGIGLVAGEIYLYLIVIYAFTGNLFVVLTILVVVFIILLLSQFAMQFVLLSLPFIVIIFKLPLIITFPFLAFGLFYLIMPTVARNYIIGQFNHKRNYLLFLSDIFILRERPSIYRDFVYDFWIKMKNEFIRGLYYMYQNPIIELIYGFPFLWFILFEGTKNTTHYELKIMYYIIFSNLVLFVLTSFRRTRFLGEPQRYVEFSIPLITILYVLNFGLKIHISLVLFSIILITLNTYLINSKMKTSSINVCIPKLLKYLEKYNSNIKSICVSNDNDLLKYLPQIDIKVIRPDLSKYYKERVSFNKYFDNSYTSISPSGLMEFISEYKPNLLIINNKYYDLRSIIDKYRLQNIVRIKQIENYEVYELLNNKLNYSL